MFTLGGDGTSMEVMDALAHTGMPIGILPGGTGNLVARALGTPLRVERAVRALLQGTTTDIDLGSVDGRRFAFSTGVGIDARMVQETPAVLKRRYGVAAYALIAARVALQRRPFGVRVEMDGDVIEGESVSLFVANFGTVLSGLLTLGPQIRPDDGCLDLCLFSPDTAAHALHIALAIGAERLSLGARHVALPWPPVSGGLHAAAAVSGRWRGAGAARRSRRTSSRWPPGCWCRTHGAPIDLTSGQTLHSR